MKKSVIFEIVVGYFVAFAMLYEYLFIPIAHILQYEFIKIGGSNIFGLFLAYLFLKIMNDV